MQVLTPKASDSAFVRMCTITPVWVRGAASAAFVVGRPGRHQGREILAEKARRFLRLILMTLRGPHPILTRQVRVADRIDHEIAALRRSLFRHPSFAQAVQDGLKLSEIRRVVALCRPGGSAAGDGVGRIERETGLDSGARLVKPAKLRERGGQV
jgi:hypothetical protein